MLSRFYIFKSASALSIIFFFQSEDRIRYRTVTGVQTCALPLYRRRPAAGIRYLSGVAPGPDLCPAKIARIRPFRPPRRRRSPFVRSVPLLMTRDPPIGVARCSLAIAILVSQNRAFGASGVKSGRNGDHADEQEAAAIDTETKGEELTRPHRCDGRPACRQRMSPPVR